MKGVWLTVGRCDVCERMGQGYEGLLAGLEGSDEMRCNRGAGLKRKVAGTGQGWAGVVGAGVRGGWRVEGGSGLFENHLWGTRQARRHASFGRRVRFRDGQQYECSRGRLCY